MLVNGDLIRMPQGAVIIGDLKEPVPLGVALEPRMGIVIESESKTNDKLIKVLLDDNVYYVNKKVIQLIRG